MFRWPWQKKKKRRELTPKELEKWIYRNTPFDEEILDCQIRAIMAVRYLKSKRYKAEKRPQLLPDGRSHAYVRWERDSERGQILWHSLGGVDLKDDIERRRQEAICRREATQGRNS
jgi:hypothetical protein